MSQLQHEYIGKYFVWTRKGHRPYFSHTSHAAALAEAERLAIKFPDRKFIVQQFLEKVSVAGEAEKEPAMNKQIWYGAKDNDVRFAENKSDLTSQGINDPRSFTVNGEVSGLPLTDANEQSSHGGQQTA